MNLPSQFRKMGAAERRRTLLEQTPRELWPDPESWTDTLADTLVEQAFGWIGLPVGLVTGLLVNNRVYHLPLATEEPSVIAAATHAARLLGRCGGIAAEAGQTITRGQLFLRYANLDNWTKVRDRLFDEAKKPLQSMEARGGGLRDLTAETLPETGLTLLTFFVDTRDAQGANVVNSLLEQVAPISENLLGGSRLMAILSNHCPERLAKASFSVPMALLAKPGLNGEEMAERIVLASRVAQENVERAVTHNKGIMNGITALALATGNDTRALEAGIHSWASRDGRYKSLSTYETHQGELRARLEIPLALATVGGATNILPGSAWHRFLGGISGASELAAAAAALGLAQNFAALMALCGEGIQQGHMSLHNKRREQ